jgi:hypothetical protein
VEEKLVQDGGNTPPPAIVRFGDTTFEVSGQDGELTFGRAESCTVCLDPEDLGISRLTGSVGSDNGVWWVTNRSRARSFSVIDDIGFPKVLAPAQRYAVEGHVRVVIEGQHGGHELDIIAPARTADGSEPGAPPGAPTAIGEDVLIRHEDRLALTALFAGYLEEGRRYDPHPRTYLAAATRLGWPKTTLIKRIEYLRTRLDKAGVPNLTGDHALESLAEYALAARIITKDDLRLLFPDR